MPSSNLPDPDKIPDMSLDGGIQATPPRELSSSSYQTEKAPPPPSPLPTESAPPDWQEDDGVLAPWEPFFLYPGTISEIQIDEARGDQALIDFDDGGQGWVFLYSLCPLEFSEGQEIHCRRNAGALYAPGKILELDGDDVHIRFDDGGREWTTISALRVPCIENGSGATATRFAFHQTPDAAPSTNSGVPSWMIWAGLSIFLLIMRVGCAIMRER